MGIQGIAPRVPTGVVDPGSGGGTTATKPADGGTTASTTGTAGAGAKDTPKAPVKHGVLVSMMIPEIMLGGMFGTIGGMALGKGAAKYSDTLAALAVRGRLNKAAGAFGALVGAGFLLYSSRSMWLPGTFPAVPPTTGSTTGGSTSGAPKATDAKSPGGAPADTTGANADTGGGGTGGAGGGTSGGKATAQ